MILKTSTGILTPQDGRDRTLLRALGQCNSPNEKKDLVSLIELAAKRKLNMHIRFRRPVRHAGPMERICTNRPPDCETLGETLNRLSANPQWAAEAEVLTVLANSGIRPGELRGLRFIDVVPADRCVKIARRKETVAFSILPITQTALDALLALNRRFTGEEFLLGEKPDHVVRRARRALAVQLKSKSDLPIGLHSLRRAFIARLVQAGADPETIKLCAGHRIPTTERLLARAKDALQKVARI